MRAAFYTLGCKVNQYDTEVMAEKFALAGFERVEFDAAADVYIINTCSVTQMSEKKSRQMISRAHALAPNAPIIVTGCYSQRAPQEVAKLPGVMIVSGTKEHGRIVEYALNALGGGERINAVDDIRAAKTFDEEGAAKEGRTRAYLKIQDGCDRYCTYCIIPYTRGPVRSRSLKSVREELERLASQGYREVVLTGIHLMSYGRDLDGVTLFDAIAQARDIDGIERIRLGSLEPVQLTKDDIHRLADDPKICRQFHLSLQSGCDRVLKRMNRRYTAEQYRECVDMLRAAMPDCAITTDIIAGFPGETAEEFEETLSFAQSIGFARVHAFPYSRREGTPAARMPEQIQNAVKAERTKRLIMVGERTESEYISRFVGRTLSVLFEEATGGVVEGYSREYIRVSAECGACENAADTLIGEIRDVRINAVEGGKLVGKVL